MIFMPVSSQLSNDYIDGHRVGAVIKPMFQPGQQPFSPPFSDNKIISDVKGQVNYIPAGFYVECGLFGFSALWDTCHVVSRRLNRILYEDKLAGLHVQTLEFGVPSCYNEKGDCPYLRKRS